MKSLSIKNPYAYWIINGIKDVENRTWKTDYRGKILIHVSGDSMRNADYNHMPEIIQKDIDRMAELKIKWEDALKETKYEELKKITELDKEAYQYYLKTENYYFKSQCIIGEIDLVDIVKDSKSVFAQKNQYNWILKNPIKYDIPILNIKGKLSLWEYKG
jgi:hypothetical protein